MFLLLVVLFSGSPAAQTINPTQPICIITGKAVAADSCIASAFPYMAIGVMLSFMIIALVYMIGNIMNFKSLQDWYRAELWESIKTMLMIAAIVAVLVIMSGVTDALVGNQYVQPLQGTPGALTTNLASLYNADNTYLAQQLNGSYQAYAAILGLNTGVSILKSFTLQLWFPIPLFTFTLPPVVFGALQLGSTENLFFSNFIAAGTPTDSPTTYSVVSNITTIVVVPMLLAFQFQATYFNLLVSLGLGILIPLGIIFRAFPMIRNIGGTLIATGIGLAIIYPALLLVLNLPVSSYIYAFTFTQTQNQSCPFPSGLLCNMWGAMISVVAQANVFSLGAVATGGATVAGADLIKLPLLASLGSAGAGNANVVDALVNGYETGLFTPLSSAGIFPTLNLILANTVGMVVQLLLLALDIMFGLIITGAVTQVLGGKVRLGIGKKFSLRTG
jgi:hypothetical protein